MNNSLFWKTAGILTLLLSVLAFLFIRTSVNTSEQYHDEVTQRLNKDVSTHIVNEVPALYDGQAVNEEEMGKLMHHVMALNPSTEVYLLDTTGNLLAKVAMDKEIKASKISVEPIKTFLEKDGDLFIKGDDPKTLDGQKIFSAAEVSHEGQVTGYIYTIVGGREYDDVAAAHKRSYVRKLEMRTILVSFLTALLFGLAALWFVTRKLNKIVTGINKFKAGDLQHRIKDVDGGELGEVASTFNEMAGELENQIEELKGVDKLRKELIANISHDLRTPVAAIQGFAETLIQKKDLSESDRDRYSGIIVQNSVRLKKQVDDLFELSKLESSARKVHAEPVQLAELLQDIADKYRLLAKEKGVSINTLYSQNLPLVMADIALIDRALQNIIDNALKFCSKGDVINLELASNRDSVSIKVVDSGQGIAAEDLPFIFDRYKRSVAKENAKGSGLGLAIVKKIMELHKTEIKVESQLDKGSTFTFDLPLYKAS